MKLFKLAIDFEEKPGFTADGLKSAIQTDLSDIGLQLVDFSYTKDGCESSPEFPALNKKLSCCECFIPYTEFTPGIPFHSVVLGGIQALPLKYPYFEISGIEPSIIEKN